MIDLHCDTLFNCILHEDYSLRRNKGHIDLERMKTGGWDNQCFAIFVPTHDTAEKDGITMDPYSWYRAGVEAFRREMAANADMIAPALTAADILRNRAAGKLTGILTVEDSVPLFGDIRRVEEFYADGVRMMSLTWNYENSVAYPNTRDGEKMALGLKEFGLECVAKMDELGMVVDVSHLSEGGFWDVVKHGKKPFAASHSCARALCDHPRNLTDEQLRALADKGGVVGVNFYSAFLSADSTHTTVDDILRHMVHIGKVAGVDALALGSDFDGIECTLEMKDCAGAPLLKEALNRHFTADEVDKICGGNVLRLLRDVVGA